MPCLRSDFSSSADTASSSTGTRRGSSSTIVTSLPKRPKIDANSTPTAPLPMIAIVLGTSRRAIASSLVMMRLRSISMPGTLRGADPAIARQACRPLDPVDLVLLEQELDALREAGDDPVLPRLNHAHVDADSPRPCACGSVAKRDAPVLGVLDDLQGVRMLEQRLGRDTAPQQARPAERLLFLDNGCFQPELRGSNRGHISAGPGADHNDVILLGH